MSLKTDLTNIKKITYSHKIDVQLTTSWTKAFYLTNIPSGSYIVSICCYSGANSLWNSIFTGICSIYSNTTNGSNIQEIALYEGGHAPGQNAIYAAIIPSNRIDANPYNYFAIKAKNNFTTSASISIHLKQLINI